MNSVRIVTRLNELRKWQNDWSRLHAATLHASFFQSFAWFEVRWKHRLPTDGDLQVAILSEGGEVTGIVPLCIQKKRTPLGDVRKLRFPIDRWGSFYGPLSATPDRTLSRVADYFQSMESGANSVFDLLEFTNLPDYREEAESSRSRPDPTNRGTWESGECSHVAMIHLEQDWNTYWESRKVRKNRRRNVERCERRLSELGKLHHVRFRPSPGENPRLDLYEACEEMAAKSWQDNLVDGHTLHHESVRPFLRETHLAAVRSGHCDLNLLFLEERPIAFCYGYHYRGYVDLMNIGFDPELSKFAPGNALWTRLIRDSYDRGDRILDLGPSCLDYKSFWMTKLETSHQSVLYNRTPASRALQLARKFKAKLPLKSADHTNREAKDLAARSAKVSVRV